MSRAPLPLRDDERLIFAPHERPPPYDPAQQPKAPEAEWNEQRLAKAKRNYAVEYIRNGVRELVNVLGRDRALGLAKLAARLTGLQHYRRMAEAVSGEDGRPGEAARFLAAMFEGMGDVCVIEDGRNGRGTCLRQRQLRIVRGLSGDERDDLLACWIEIWRGAVHSHRAFMDVAATWTDDTLLWTIVERDGASR